MDDARHAIDAPSASERLLEESWEARSRRASRRELAVECAAGVLFAATAAAFALIAGTNGLRLGEAGLLVAIYALVARVEFPIGAGHVVPSQLVLVPMLVVLPPAVVPAAVAAALVGLTTVDWALGRTTARRIVSAVPDAWHAVGPALVLAVTGVPELGLGALPTMAAAFAASCIVDLVASLTRMRLTGLVPDFRAQVGVVLTVWAVDACLAPIGFLGALATQHGAAAALCMLPLAALLWLLARDRNRRIAQAHARLKLVEHERTRLQSAVRRLGDAFVAKLELDGLFEILLHGSLEALDADGGRFDLSGLGHPAHLVAGAIRLPEANADSADTAGPTQVQADDVWTLTLPVHITTQSGSLAGFLRYARRDRRFEDDEVRLLSELVAKAQMAAAEILANQLLRAQAVTDALTGLGNRRQLSADLGLALKRASAQAPELLLLFDLDGFKNYNDTFGHLAGDALLTRLGTKLATAVAPDGTAYRLGGDEFCALLRLDGADLEHLMARTTDALTETGAQFTVGASLGAVLLPHEADSPDHALQLADERMYTHKRSRATGPRDQARDVLMRTMQAKQPNLDEHASEVAQLATRVARQLGLTGESLDEIARAAELHDIGKVGIPDAILNKPAALEAEEWEFMRQHTVLGERILNAAPALRPVARIVRASHERWDGAGYPDGLRGEQIPLAARIVAVCDAYEAITANRPYRRARSHHAACQELHAAAGSQFDPSVVVAFLDAIHADHRGDEPGTGHPVEAAVAHVRALLAASS